MVTTLPITTVTSEQHGKDHATWYRALFEHATDLIIVLNANGTRRFVSPSMTRILGYELSTYLAFGTFDLIHPDDRPAVQAGHADCLAHHGPQAPCRYRLRHANGTWRTFEGVRSNLLQDPDVEAMIITARDVTDSERARRRLYESESQFRSAFTFAAIGMALVGLDGRWLTANRALCAITGYSSAELMALTFQDITHPDDLHADLAHVESLLAGRADVYQMEKRYFKKDGTVVWVLLSVSMVKDELDQPLHFIAQIQDISARKAAEQTLRDSEARFRTLLANAADIVLLLDAMGRVRWASPSVNRVLGLDAGELVGRSNVELVHPDDRGKLRRAFVDTVRAPDIHRATIRFMHRDGSFRWLESVGVNHLDNPAIAGVVINARDVSDQVELQQRLREQALHDPLTGLPNRTMFDERLRLNLATVRRTGGSAGVLFIDLNEFKAINDTSGHASGDQVLRAIGRRLVDNVRPTDLVARIGGDEFAIALARVDEADDIPEIVERLAAVVTLPLPIGGRMISVSASFGWAASDNGLEDPEELVSSADHGMYQQKHLTNHQTQTQSSEEQFPAHKKARNRSYVAT